MSRRMQGEAIEELLNAAGGHVSLCCQEMASLAGRVGSGSGPCCPESGCRWRMSCRKGRHTALCRETCREFWLPSWLLEAR